MHKFSNTFVFINFNIHNIHLLFLFKFKLIKAA